MSLEQAILDHASAIRELAAAIRGAGTGQVGTAAAAHVAEATQVVEKAQASAKKSGAKKPDPKPDPVEAPVEESAATQEQKGDDAAADVEVTRDQVRDVTLELGKAGKRDALIALLSDLGVAKSSQLEDNQLGEFFTRATELLGA